MKLLPNSTGKVPPRQLIMMGAPGTGKSHQLKKICDDSKLPENQIFRVTFHPELSYGDFVGVYKPTPVFVSTGSHIFDSRMQRVIVEQGRETINLLPLVKYEYRCGPLINAYCEARKNPDKDFIVIIEEINRASPSTVFGDAIQLLDRNDDHVSVYPINTSPDLEQMLAERNVPDPSHLQFPSNLFIWGTMNRADETVNYIDSAFLRRWDASYLRYDGKSSYDTTKVSSPEGLEWGSYRRQINARLSKIGNIEDDKFIGPFFLKKHELADSQRVFSKLITYLWHDVVPMDRPRIFEDGSLSELFSAWDSGTPILKLGDA